MTKGYINKNTDAGWKSDQVRIDDVSAEERCALRIVCFHRKPPFVLLQYMRGFVKYDRNAEQISWFCQ